MAAINTGTAAVNFAHRIKAKKTDIPKTFEAKYKVKKIVKNRSIRVLSMSKRTAPCIKAGFKERIKQVKFEISKPLSLSNKCPLRYAKNKVKKPQKTPNNFNTGMLWKILNRFPINKR